MKIRDRASLYAASRCSIVMRCFLLALLRPPILPDSDGSMSEESASSPFNESACEWDFGRRSCKRRMILNAGWAVASAGTKSASLRVGLKWER